MDKEKIVIVPNVQSMETDDGQYTMPDKVRINFGGIENKFDFFLNNWLNYEAADSDADITIAYNGRIKPQGYKLTIKDSVTIEYSEECGVLYAFTTLKQIVAVENGILPQLTIEDWPDIKQRGLMLDVSRGRMTKIEVIKDIVDWLVGLKYNQLQLYFDAIIFEYPGFEKTTAGKILYTPNEIKELSDYCTERFIQLVPNQNSFAHMEAWTRQPEFSHLAVTKDDGTKSGTLNPLEKSSIDFMDKVYGALLPSFDAEYINIGCDEAWELGQGETKSECEKLGSGTVYMNYLMKLYALIKEKYNCIPMFWDDIAMHHPELIPQLPKDMIVIEWGYEFDHPFDEHCKILHDLDLRYYVSPGTGTWNSICGRTVNMAENIRRAAKYAIKYNAEGFLLTDWGDGGQPQPLACSIPPYVLGAMYSWHVENLEKCGKEAIASDASYYSNKYIFETEFNLFGWLLRVGKCCHFEGTRRLNATLLWENFRDCHPQKFALIEEYAELLAQELKNVKLNCKLGELVLRELQNVCRLLCVAADPEAAGDTPEIWKKEYIELWDMRSKHDPIGYGENTGYMDNYIARVKEMNGNGENVPLGITDIKWFF